MSAATTHVSRRRSRASRNAHPDSTTTSHSSSSHAVAGSSLHTAGFRLPHGGAGGSRRHRRQRRRLDAEGAALDPPPVARRAPRSGRLAHRAEPRQPAGLERSDAHRPAALQLDPHWRRLAEPSQGEAGRRGRLGLGLALGLCLRRLGEGERQRRGRSVERPHPDGAASMRVERDRAADAPVTHHRTQPRGQRGDRLGPRMRAGQQRRLDDAAGQRLERHCQHVDGGRRRMRFEIEDDQRPQHARIAHRHRQAEAPHVELAGHQPERRLQRDRAEAIVIEPRAQRIDDAPEREGQRLDGLDRPLEGARRLERLRLGGRHQRPRVEPARHRVPGQPRRAEALEEIGGRQRRQRAERRQAPAPPQRQRHLGAGRGRRPRTGAPGTAAAGRWTGRGVEGGQSRDEGDRPRRQHRGFGPCRHDHNRPDPLGAVPALLGAMEGHQQCRGPRRGHRDRGRHATIGGLLPAQRGDLRLVPEQPGQAARVHDHDAGPDDLDPWRRAAGHGGERLGRGREAGGRYGRLDRHGGDEGAEHPPALRIPDVAPSGPAARARGR